MFNIGNKESIEFDVKSVNNLRGLSLDMICNANSGHPGICLGAASILYTLYKKHLNISLTNLNFINRDRFILSSGHGAPLFYSILYFLGLLTIEDLESLRKVDSKTPGHPEYLKTPLVEATTGLLGQGIAQGVGMAIAERYLNNITSGVIDHNTYVLCGDGELEEGITYESLSLAGTLQLNKLIVLCDLNNVTLDNSLEYSSTEDLKKRFESIHFNVLEVDDDVESIDEAIQNAKRSNLPSIIFVKTIIGLHLKNQGTNLVHGNIPLEDDVNTVKEKLGLYQTPFTVNQEVIESFKQQVLERGVKWEAEYQEKCRKSNKKELLEKLDSGINTFEIMDFDFEVANSTLKESSGEILNFIAKNFELLIGGSADLSSSCKTYLKDSLDFTSKNYSGKNIFFGIREHAMAGILNGMALSGLRPFGSTFLAFSDYMKPAIRMSAMMNLPVLYIFTNDSITVGEDGPTHEPVEQLPSLELIPNLKVYRPYDFNELMGSFQEIFKNTNPACLILPRNFSKVSTYTSSSKVGSGMYVLIENETDDYINLLSSGEELEITIALAKNLKELGIDSKVISIPCLKNIQEEAKKTLLTERTFAITFSKSEYFYPLTKNVYGMDSFGSSGSKDELILKYGFDLKTLESKILDQLNK